MRRITEFINEKLKVSKTPVFDITLESLIKALNDYKDRTYYKYALYQKISNSCYRWFWIY